MNSKLKQARTNSKMTQTEVAEKLGISTAAYHMYETGKRNIPKDKAEKLAKIYKVKTDEFFLPSSFSIR